MTMVKRKEMTVTLMVGKAIKLAVEVTGGGGGLGGGKGGGERSRWG